MALIKCPDCSKDVSDIAPSCPHCGRPIADSPGLTLRTGEQSVPEKTKTGPRGQSPKEQKRRSGCLTILLVLFGLGLLSSLVKDSDRERSTQPSRSSASTPSPSKGAWLNITVEKTEYSSGFFEVVGTVKNTGDVAAFSPTIVLKVYDSSGKTLLAEDKSWPAGQLFKKMEPGTTAAFQHLVSVPGDPGRISWRIDVPDYPFVANHKNKLVGAGFGKLVR